MTEKQFGKHYLIELIDCDSELISYKEHVEKALIDATKEAGATYISHQSHQFSPKGVSVVVMISESHITAHTWPESSYAAIDIFTCGEMCAPAAVATLRDRFGATHVREKTVIRGF